MNAQTMILANVSMTCDKRVQKVWEEGVFLSAKLYWRKASIQALFFATVGIKGLNSRSYVEACLYRNLQTEQGSQEAKVPSTLENQDRIPSSPDGL